MSQKPGMLLSFRCVAHLCIKNLIQQKGIIISFALIIFLSACNNQNATSNEQPLPSNDSSVFYPVQEYFSNQLASADTLKNVSYTHVVDNITKDSSVVDSAKIHELAKPFFADDINDIKVKKYYKETIFHDLSTASNTFTYTSVNNKLPIQSLDVLLDTITNLVKRVDITKSYTQGDTLITEKMWWKSNEGFSVNKILQLPNKTESIQQTNVLWSKD